MEQVCKEIIMAKKIIIDIDAEFDDVFFDEKKITFETSAKLRTQDPKWIEKITKINQARAQDPEALAKHRATMQSDEYKQAHRAGLDKPGYTEAKSTKMKDLWADPAYRALQEERLADPEVKAKQRAAARKREDNPDYQRRKKEWSSKFKDDTERSAKLSKARLAYMEAHPEARQELSDMQKRIQASRTKEDYDAIHAKRLSTNWLESITQAAKKRRQPLLTPEGVFDSKKEAHLHYGFDPAMVDYNRKKKPNEWFFIAVEDYEKCLNNPKHMNKLRKLRAAGQYEEVVKKKLTQQERDAKVQRAQKPCITPMGIFSSLDQAGIAHDRTRNWVREQLKIGITGFNYISKEEYIMLTGKDL